MEEAVVGSKGKGVKKESNDSLSNSASSHSRDDEVEGDWEGKGFGISSSSNSGFCLLSDREIVEMVFSSEDEAYKFYNAYARAKGFSIRKSRSKGPYVNEIHVRSRAWVCSREGKRHPKHLERIDRTRRSRAETRLGCGAKFRVRYVKETGKYIVTHFVSEHNHPLAAEHCVPFLRSHRYMDDADTAQASAMRRVGMKQGQIMDYMTTQSGGFHNVGFTSKDLRNKLEMVRKEEIKNGDAEGALGYLAAQQNSDPLFFFKYGVDENDRLERLFWADGRSRMDYAAFGDVLVFDTTYRTNAYKKPFVILAGVSNHFKTTIFGCALLASETEETYDWVLATFLEAMGGKKPISVLTDGDLAMRNAIRNLFLDARHRLCMWHVERNAAKNVHIPEFVSDFTTMMKLECDVEEFETVWDDMVSHYGLETNGWVLEMYKDRERWAEAYQIGHFFAGMRTTQRCEGMNRYLNQFLTVRLRLYEFVDHYHRGLARMRVADARAETVTEHSTPVLVTQMKSLERSGAELYTRNIFENFQDEIQRSSPLVVAHRVMEQDRSLYFIEMYSHPESKWVVEYFRNGDRMTCSCLMFESFGLPCCHMILVMKHEHVTAIPPNLVMRRWTRAARPEGNPQSVPKIGGLSVDTARFGILRSGYNLMSFYASNDNQSFEDAREVGHQMTTLMRKRWERAKNSKNNDSEQASNVHGLFGVADPHKVRTKGNPGNASNGDTSKKKPRKCRLCNCPGHDKRTCHKLRSNRS